MNMTTEEYIRYRREKECFPIINRGKLWYDMLTFEQVAELKEWYRKWLDAPATLYVPDLPSWVNSKITEEEEII